MRWAAALLVLLAAPARAAGPPQVRVQLEPDRALVGQGVRVDVQVLAPNFFTAPPEFPVFELPGAVVRLLDDRAVNSTETIGGESFAGIQKSYLVTAQRPGEFTLPAVKIPFAYAAEPGKPGVQGAVTLPPRTFTVRAPAGTQSATGAAPVARVTLTQRLDREPRALKVGDALTRTVVTFAPGTQPMLLPPPALDAPAGVRAYRRDPMLTEVTDPRGSFLGGQRVDTVTYTFERAGSYTLPAVEVAWVDAATGRRELARAPAIPLSIAAAPRWTPSLAPRPEAPPVAAPRTFGWASRLIGAGTLLLLAAGATWLARRILPRLRGWAARRRRAAEDSEAAWFRRLRSACKADDGAAAYRDLEAWARRAGPDASLLRDPDLEREVAALERSLFGPGGERGWRGAGLAAAAGRSRRSLRPGPGRARPPRSALPKLDPWTQPSKGSEP